MYIFIALFFSFFTMIILKKVIVKFVIIICNLKRNISVQA